MADYRSSMLSGVIRLCLQTDQNASLIPSLPTVISHHQLFGSQQFGSLNDIIGDVNNQLNSSKKRLQGLILLDCLIQQGSADTFSSHCQTWLNLLLQALQSPSSDQVHKLSLTVLSSLIERITSFPELARDVGTMYIGQLLPLLLTFSSGVKDEAITCIHTCVIHFPGPSGNFLNKIKSMLVEELDRATPSQAAVQCYTSLAQCGSVGTQGTKHRKGWAEMCDSLVSSLIFWLGQLYEGLEMGLQEEEQGSDNVFGSCQLPSTQPQQTVHIVHRFQTLCLCLESLLRESFSTWVQIPADKILKLICRALAVHLNMVSCKATTNYLLLLSYLPSIHISVLKVLSQLIVCCKRLLMPQASLIFRLVIQCLTTTNRNNMVPGVEKPFRELRESAYYALVRWLQVSGSGGLMATKDEQEDLLKEISFDIMPMQDIIKIDVKSSDIDGKVTSTKKKTKGVGGYQELAQSSSSQWHGHRVANAGSATAALKALHIIVHVSGVRLHPEVFKCIQKTIVFVVRSVQQNLPPPYISMTCRQVLYRALLSVACLPYPSLPSLLQVALTLFQQGLLDPDYQVVFECQEALVRCEGLIHPVAPSVRGPVITSVCTLDISSGTNQTASNFSTSVPIANAGMQTKYTTSVNTDTSFSSEKPVPDRSSPASVSKHHVSMSSSLELKDCAVALSTSSDIEECEDSGRKRKLSESDSDDNHKSSTIRPRFHQDVREDRSEHDSDEDEQRSVMSGGADTNLVVKKEDLFLQKVTVNMADAEKKANISKKNNTRKSDTKSDSPGNLWTEDICAVSRDGDSLQKQDTTVETILMTFVDADQELD